MLKSSYTCAKQYLTLAIPVFSKRLSLNSVYGDGRCYMLYPCISGQRKELA